MSHQQDLANANPSKAFFIDMITRDLGLADCILDLIDNAVDQAVRHSKCDVMAVLTNGADRRSIRGTVALDFSRDHFTISDTCGGIPTDEARNTVFLFGNPAEHGAKAGLSVYGIGMKRAFFKLGRHITMTSHTRTTSFTLAIDVDKWNRSACSRTRHWRGSA